MNQKLIDRVLKEIKSDVQMGDLTAIEELLRFCPEENLLHYLPEEEWKHFKLKNQ